MEINEASASDYEPKPEPEGSDHGADVGGQSEPEEEPPYVAPGVPSIDCLSKILTKYARGPYDSKSPLKQFATKITHPTPSSGGTHKWKCNICGLVALQELIHTSFFAMAMALTHAYSYQILRM